MSLSPLYREERRSLLCSEKDDVMACHGMSSGRETLPPLDRGEKEYVMSCHVMACHVMSCHVIEKRETLSSAKRMSLSPLYREERDTLSPVERRRHSPHLQKERVSLLSIEKRDTLSSAQRRSMSCHVMPCHGMSSGREKLPPLYREEILCK